MCGIAGFLREHPDSQPGDAALLNAMADQLTHRGPDDHGVWTGGGAGLAHRRLSIIDLSAHGRQPMQRGPWVISYNGEIYNHAALRQELMAAGETFTTQTDTEVLLLALARWGEAALHKLNGMFAFALWNENDRTLLLARDRIGKKPLYYANCNGDFVFASEMKAFLAHPDFERRADFEAIHHYLSLQYVPAPWTALRGVKALPPGSILRVTPANAANAPEPQRYWTLPSPKDAVARDSADVQAEIREKLSAAVKRRMVADVPVGAFLSGGIDSSAVTAFMAEHSANPVKTFCIGFDETDFDERRYARLVAERFGTDHEEEIVRPDAMAILPEIIWHYEDPFADPSAIPTYYVSQLARRHVTVSLSGDGGDEFFLGYNRYDDCAAMGWVDHLPTAVRRMAGAGANAISPGLARRRPFGGLRWRLLRAAASNAQRYEPAMMYFFNIDKKAGYGDGLRPYLANDTLNLLQPYFDDAPNMVAGAAWADIHSYLPDDLLVKVDRASMAHSLEARAPFLDVELMELAASIPSHQKLQGGLKGLLKSALREIVPDAVLDRPKMGFGLPIERWFRQDLHDFTLDILTSANAQDRGLFQAGYVETLMHEHRDGPRLHHTKLWAMLVLELWFQAWIDGAPARPE
ncbi:MAG: asparagine synthase (glutamine-hydrolyzing) [Pseudomonadota bacterium]